MPLLTYEEEEDFRRFPLQSITKRVPIVEYVMQSNSTLSLKQVMLKACYNYHQRKGFMSRNHACLSKFLGCHNTTWVSLKRKYNLKWSSGKGSLEIFERCYGDDSTSLDTMLQWLRQMREELPLPYSNVFLFCTLTGLRTNESF